MPEIKNAFIKGKMNKDLDERLVPNGEYRDAVNIDVDYSEGSDVGALKNILGNTQRDTISLTSAKCIGTVKDVENNKIYWFITSSAKDLIAEWDYATNTYDTILVDSGSVLNFNTDNYITGANVLDGFLFFTDNLNEPRQIDIEYWRSQTSGSAGTSTGLTAERITVIKKSPLAAPTLDMSSSARTGIGTSGNGSTLVMDADFGSQSSSGLVDAIDAGTSFNSASSDFSKFKVGTTPTNPAYNVGDVIILTHKFLDTTDDTTKTIKVRIKLTTYDSTQTGNNVGTFTAKILTISEKVPGTAVAYTCVLEEDEPLFKEKFPRFAYRYKYNNGQYSCFSPFSNAAFLPDPTVAAGEGFEYNQKDGFNQAMVNSLRLLKIKNINHNIHADVEEIDIIYKDSVGSNCYLVDTIKRTNGNFPNPLEFEVKDDQIFKTLPSNQLLRLFDSVPKRAKAQEVTANRLIYGNYTENFNLKDSNNADVKPVFDLELQNRYNPGDSGYASDRLERQSIKSSRTYQFGVVYTDEFGRQTPVLTSDSGVIKVGQESAPFMTQLKAKITSNPPAFATHYKYFIKENSKVTNNLVADSFYEDDEGYIYISMPSSEVNKVQTEDIIVIKKKTGNAPSEILEEFKVLDKLLTPPPFLARPMRESYRPDKFRFSRNFEQDHDQVLIKPGTTPVPKRNRVTIRTMFRYGDSHLETGSSMNNAADHGVSRDAYSAVSPGKFVKFIAGDVESNVYEIATKELNIPGDNDIELHFTEEFGDDVKGLYEDFDGNPNSTELLGGQEEDNPDNNNYGGPVMMVVVEEKDESGKPEFAGRFFLKIKSTSFLLNELRGEENLNNLQAQSTMSLDGDQTDNDPRQFHMYGGGKAGTNSLLTKFGADNNGALVPMSGGFDHTTDTSGFGISSFGPGVYYTSGAITTNTAIGTIFVPANELDQGYHFAIRSDKPTSDSDSKYGSLGFIRSLEKAPTNKNGFNTDNDIYLKFDRSQAQITANQPADDQFYKVERVFKYIENATHIAPIGNLSFRDRDAVYLVKLDKNLAQNLVFNGQTGANNVMQMTAFEFKKKQLINIVNPPIFEVVPKDDVDIDIYYETQEVFPISDHGNDNVLSYYNCFSFENGVESFIIRDDFNAPSMGKGVRVSTVFEDKPYIEETLKNNLIFSQIYNGKNALNRLNQFIIAEGITKEINPDYGSIQLLHTRYNDIIAYCENKVLKILTNKDALFNADGNVNITSNKAVLGQAMPYNSNYGISTNPESFAAYTHRSYFTDRKNGVVVRHSMDGMEAISDYGMKDFFRDALPANTGLMVGSYDVRKHQYNISTHTATANSTVSFSESINGWVSKKSFIPEAGESIQNKYFTFKNGHIYEHHTGTVNTFYGVSTTPYVELILNASPANMKNFRTLNYEGDSGWACPSFVTDQQDGSISTFVNKENKYFGYVRGVTENTGTIDFKALNVQGIGNWATINLSGGTVTLTFAEAVPNDLQIGDVLYYVHPSTSATTKFGPVTVVNETEVRATYTGSPPTSPAYFVFYVKNASWETSGLLGYHATVKMQNTANTVKEIYAVGSEISISS